MKHSHQKKFLLLAILIHQCLAERQKRRNRFYLTRSNLNPSSRSATAWEYLYESKDDRAFILTMGVGVSVFQQLLNSGFEAAWNTMPIPRADVLSTGKIAGSPSILDVLWCFRTCSTSSQLHNGRL